MSRTLANRVLRLFVALAIAVIAPALSAGTASAAPSWIAGWYGYTANGLTACQRAGDLHKALGYAQHYECLTVRALRTKFYVLRETG